MGRMRLDWGEWQDSEVHVGLILLTYTTTLNILSYILHKAQPPKFSGDKLAGLKVPGVSHSLMVVALG